MIIPGSGLTARQAADQFAASYSDDGPRKVCDIALAPNSHIGITFALVGGVRRYLADSLPSYDGWEITPCSIS